MSYPKIAKLVEALLTQTENGSLQWEPTEKSDTFQASFPRYSVRLFVRHVSEFDVDYILQIINDFGDIVEEISDPDLNDVLDSAYRKMREVHEAARRSAMGVESALDEILGFLEPF